VEKLPACVAFCFGSWTVEKEREKEMAGVRREYEVRRLM
jgi:hypothetical protein